MALGRSFSVESRVPKRPGTRLLQLWDRGLIIPRVPFYSYSITYPKTLLFQLLRPLYYDFRDAVGPCRVHGEMRGSGLAGPGAAGAAEGCSVRSDSLLWGRDGLGPRV